MYGQSFKVWPTPWMCLCGNNFWLCFNFRNLYKLNKLFFIQFFCPFACATSSFKKFACTRKSTYDKSVVGALFETTNYKWYLVWYHKAKNLLHKLVWWKWWWIFLAEKKILCTREHSTSLSVQIIAHNLHPDIEFCANFTM